MSKLFSYTAAAAFGASLPLVAHLRVEGWQFWVVFILASLWRVSGEFGRSA